jgi:hypothetical protein
MAERAEVSPPKIAVNPAGFSCAAVSVGDHLVRRGQRRCKTVMHARQIRALDPILAAGAGGDAEYPLDITDVLAAVGCKACGALADADVPAPPPRPRDRRRTLRAPWTAAIGIFKSAAVARSSAVVMAPA